MRILLITPLYPPDLGDQAIYIKELAIRLSKNASVELLTYGDYPEEIPEVKITTVSKRLPLIVRLGAFFLQLWQASQGTDIIYVSDGASVGLPALLLSWLRSAHLVRHFRTDERWERASVEDRFAFSEERYLQEQCANLRARFIYWLQRSLLRRAAAVITSTPTHEASVKQALAASEPHQYFVPYPPAKQLLLPFHASRSFPQIVSLSPLREHEGLEEALDAVAYLAPSHPHLRLILANDGPGKVALIDRAKKLCILDRVAILGTISAAEQQDLLRTSTIGLCLHSFASGVREIFEYYSHGVVCVAHEAHRHPRVIEHDRSGQLLSLHTSRELADYLDDLLHHPERCTQFRQEGTRLMKRESSWEAHEHALLKIFQETATTS